MRDTAGHGWKRSRERRAGTGAGLVLLAGALAGAQTYREAFPGVTFKVPTAMVEIPGKPGHFLVLEKNLGNIVLVRAGASTREDIAKVDAHKYGFEMGLIGIAFHPDFKENRKYYVNYNNGIGPLATVLEERQMDASLLKDAGKLREILRIPQPDANHKGGTLGFGRDGYLYVSTGDGGSQGDPQGNGQNTGVLLAKMLRIDVDRKEDGKEYAIPADNPFAKGGGRGEIWAYGLRNPWKWSFDPLTGEQWLGDVGGGGTEEINVIKKGHNYGWAKSEGFAGVTAGITAPAYGFARSDARAVIGGLVYRGDAASKWFGHFLVSDYETRRLWALKPAGGDNLGKATATLLADPPGKPTSFATDHKGRVYILNHEGKIFLLEGTDWAGGAVSVLPSAGPLRERFGAALAAAPGGVLRGDALPEGDTYEIRSMEGTLEAVLQAREPVLPASLRQGVYLLRAAGPEAGAPGGIAVLLVR